MFLRYVQLSFFIIGCTVLCYLPITVQTEAIQPSIDHRLPIVYVYTVVKAVCRYGLPGYIKVTLEQAVLSQPDSDVYMASNYAECPHIGDAVDTVAHVKKVDITSLISDRTREFMNVSQSMFEVDGGSELWLTSAYRFFNLEDMMIKYNMKEIMHVEADNLLYGNFTSLLPLLRKGYPGLAATPLNSNKSFITASVFWIANLAVLKRFNDFLLDLGRNTDGAWKKYLTWLRPFGCCKPGGIDPDEFGKGIKPFAVNEMSMLAYYHHIRPEDFYLLPVVPRHDYLLNKYVCNMSDFGPDGKEIPMNTFDGVWDPNSWGQYLGGTSNRKGRDRGFTDSSHIAGQAMRTSGCRPQVLCANRTTQAHLFSTIGEGQSSPALASNIATLMEKKIQLEARIKSMQDELVSTTTAIAAQRGGVASAGTATQRGRRLGSEQSRRQIDAGDENRHLSKVEPAFRQLAATAAAAGEGGGECYTAPFVRCREGAPWTPLWNLHVHAKHTQDYKSVPCQCTS